MKFKKEQMQELVYEDEADMNGDIGSKISEEICGTDRWTNTYEMIFKVGQKFYQTYYRVGATEMQDESPFEYDKDEIDCPEVEKVEIVSFEWKVIR